ncbi:basic membrane protein A [Paenibacillus phyllosphaerae]|uniref:Basic membrane protein A n=1 Tax=Paenibacillus phyllosphaerae TaxID=274593 RepID=A0A7W5FRB8_9BACL|nr:BMP family protein [Paenibacillus phyllosphaerae]MBB3114132.1 basic membrane protein A [Paenibacillus phyllosphaerae]
MKKRLMWVTMIALVLTLALAGCGSKNNEGNNGANSGTTNTGTAENGATNGADTETTEGGANGKDFRIGMATDVGGVNDKSFNQSAWEGLQEVEKATGASVKYLESKGDADMEPNLNKFVKDGYDLTWGIGFLFADAMKNVATQNPDAKLAVIDSTVDAPNVESVTFAEHEGSYLVGVVAGLMTKTNKVGFVGGMDIPVIKKFEAGFKAGVTAVNPNAEIKINYTGDFSKPDLGKAAAATMYNDGVDIIFHASGATGNGVFTEAKDRVKSGNQVWVIGVDKDQSLEFGDEVTLTSMMKGVKQAVEKVSTDLINGTWAGGTTTVLGLKDNAVGLPETSTKNVPADVLAKVEEYKQKIVSGEITVPTE